MKVIRMKSVFCALLMGSAVAASASTIVANGSFENPVTWGSIGQYVYTPTDAGLGWSFVGGSGVTANNTAWNFSNAPDGTQVAFLQNTSEISQTVSLIAGDSYTLSFYLEQRPEPYQSNPVSLAVGDSAFVAITPANNYSWIPYTETFTANSSTELLSFSTTNPSGDHDTGIDGVSITQNTAATPEPGSLALLGSGILSLAGLARRRFARSA